MKSWLRLALLASVLLAATAMVLHARAERSAPAPVAATLADSGAGGPLWVAEGRLAAYPGAEVVVSSEVAGLLVALPVEEGQRVRRGELLARLRSDDLAAELAEARAALTQARAEVALAELEHRRAEDLLAKKVDTVARRDRAARDLDVAQARETAAGAAIARLEAELAKRRLLAPIDGTVVVRSADPGETVEARVPLVTLVDLQRVRIEAEVDEFDAGRVRVGAPVEVSAEGYDDQRWRGVVEEIPDSVSARRLKPQDPGKPSDTRVLIVKVRLTEPTPLKLGQRVEVSARG